MELSGYDVSEQYWRLSERAFLTDAMGFNGSAIVPELNDRR
jgi:hypothetical protein